MSIFNIINKDDELFETNESFDEVYGHEDSLMEILHESSFEFAQLRASMYISDCLMEQKIMEGSSAEVLYENFAVDFFENIKKIFLSLLNRVKDFFKKLIDNLKMFFLSGTSFIKKYEKEIKDKKDKGYEYEAFKYTYNRGEKYVETVYDECISFASGLTKSIDDVSIDKMKKVLKEYTRKETPVAQDLKNNLLKKLGAKDIRDVIENVYNSFRDGKEDKTEMKDFEGNSKDEMIKIIKESGNLIKSIEKDRNHIISVYSNVIRSVEKAKRKLKDEENYGKITSAASVIISAIKFSGSVALSATRVKINIVKQMSKSFEIILKGYLRYKNKDEKKTTNESTSIIESALKYL